MNSNLYHGKFGNATVLHKRLRNNSLKLKPAFCKLLKDHCKYGNHHHPKGTCKSYQPTVSQPGGETHFAGTAPAMKGIVAHDAQAKQTLSVTILTICAAGRVAQNINTQCKSYPEILGDVCCLPDISAVTAVRPLVVGRDRQEPQDG